MDPKSFYSKKKVPARPIPNPEISQESDLSSDSDDNTGFVPDPNLESETEDETNVSETDSDTDLPQPPSTSTSPAKMLRNDPLRWKTVPKEHVDLNDLPFTGNPPLGQLPIQEPIDYFRDILVTN